MRFLVAFLLKSLILIYKGERSCLKVREKGILFVFALFCLF